MISSFGIIFQNTRILQFPAYVLPIYRISSMSRLCGVLVLLPPFVYYIQFKSLDTKSLFFY